MLRTKIKTNYWLWTMFSVILFIALGSVNWVPEGKGGISYWGVWYLYFDRGGYEHVNSDTIFVLIASGIVHALPAVVLGWVGQALIQTFLTLKRVPS